MVSKRNKSRVRRGRTTSKKSKQASTRGVRSLSRKRRGGSHASLRGGVVRVLGDQAVFDSSVENEEAQAKMLQQLDSDTRDEEQFDPLDENGLRASNRVRREAFEPRFKKSMRDQMAETYDPTKLWSADSSQLLTPEERQKRKEEGISNKRAHFFVMNRAVEKTNTDNIEEKDEIQHEIDNILSYMASQHRQPNRDERDTLHSLYQQMNKVDREIRVTSAKQCKISNDRDKFETEQL